MTDTQQVGNPKTKRVAHLLYTLKHGITLPLTHSDA